MNKTISILPLILCLVYGCNNISSAKNNRNVKEISVNIIKKPVLAGKTKNELIYLTISADNNDKKELSVNEIDIDFTYESRPQNLSAINIFHAIKGSVTSSSEIFGITENPSFKNKISGKAILTAENDSFIISFVSSASPDLTAKLEIKRIRIHFSDHSVKDAPLPDGSDPLRFGLVLRAAGQDSCNTYRIPGLITTKSGALIAVYDNRYRSSKDLQEDIDIGMSRSTDRGASWEPMKVIMDMDEYGGFPEELNGTGDPCILYDNKTNTIWVAALWMSGAARDKMIWFASQPGMRPEVTGQFMLVKSTDDGLTWSQPLNITDQIKDPAWQLLFQGPGRGITMKDGTIVFPAQFKADIGVKAIDGGQYTCYSTIIWSRDEGITWHIGTGAKTNTTESQVVELSDGTLMLNMRDDRNRTDKSETNGRAVAVTRDLGKTWRTHPSSNHSLPEPNCMASLIAADLKIMGSMKRVLFFSNPANKTSRSEMTIKASLDEGLSWPAEYQIRLNQAEGYGYSCLTMIDENTIGILYEGVRDLYFQKIHINDIIRDFK